MTIYMPDAQLPAEPPPAPRADDVVVASPPASRRDSALTYALAITGEVFITIGILLALMVVWQIWWTDIEANSTQQDLVDELIAEGDFVQPAIEANSDVVVVDGVPSGPTVAAERHEGPPPVMAEPANTSTFGTMYVPRWGADYVKPISEGVSRSEVLDRKGIGHYPETAELGAEGNFAVAAHRTTFGRPFHNIDQLKVGDAIVIQANNTWYVYKITEYLIVAPSAIEVLAPVPGKVGSSPDGYFLTLTTCHPKYSAKERYIVHAELDYWAPSDSGTPLELLEKAS